MKKNNRPQDRIVAEDLGFPSKVYSNLFEDRRFYN